MHKVLWILYFSIAPFLYTELSFDSFALKQAFFLVVLATQSCFFFYCIKDSSKFFRLKHFDYLIIGFFILRLISSFSYIQKLGVYPSLGTILFEFYLCIFYLQLRILRIDNSTLDSCLKCLTTSSFFVFILQVLSIFKPLQNTNRFDANFFHPNVLGITFCSILIYYHTKQEKRPIFFVFSFILLLVSFSKTAYILYALFLLGRTLHLSKQSLKFNLKKLIQTLILLFFAYCFFIVNNQDPLSKFRNQFTQSLIIKGYIYQSSISGILTHPFGHGTGLYPYKIQQYLPLAFHDFYPNPNHHTLYKAHNYILETSFESGILVFILLLYGLLYLFSHDQNPIKYCLISLSIASFFSVHLNYPESQILFLILLATLVSSKDYLYD